MKKLISVILFGMFILCMPAAADGLYIVHTNDVHGHFSDNLGYASAAALIDDLRNTGDVILLDAGDALHGTQEVIEYQGASAVEIMNLMEYDAMTVGNHEYDYSLETLRERETEMDFALLSANSIYENGTAAFLENIIIERGGFTVGIFGLTTPSTVTTTKYGRNLPYSFAAGDELYEIAQKQVDTLRERGCDLVICLSHLGLDDFDAPSTSRDIAEHVKGIDLIIDGHSHTVLEDGLLIEDTLIVSTGAYLQNLGIVTITEDKEITAELVSSYDKKNTEVDELVTSYIQETEERYGQEVGISEVFLDGTRMPGVRNSETNLGDLCADAVLYSVNTAGFKADAALVNGGGIRASIEPGTITRLDLLDVMPYNNLIAVIEVPGQIILQALEDNTAAAPAESGGFPQVSGIKYTIDTDKTFAEGKVNRVSISEIAGKPFDADKMYRIAVSEFIAKGGDSYTVFAPYYSGESTDILDSEVLEHYITEALCGVIGEEYKEPKGRISFGTVPASPSPAAGIIAGLALACLILRRR